jgi:hypothetical protein
VPLAHHLLERVEPRPRLPVRLRPCDARGIERPFSLHREAHLLDHHRRLCSDGPLGQRVGPVRACVLVEDAEERADGEQLVGIRGLRRERLREHQRRHEGERHGARLAEGAVEVLEGRGRPGPGLARGALCSREIRVRFTEGTRDRRQQLLVDEGHEVLGVLNRGDLLAAGEEAIEFRVGDVGHGATAPFQGFIVRGAPAVTTGARKSSRKSAAAIS